MVRKVFLLVTLCAFILLAVLGPLSFLTAETPPVATNKHPRLSGYTPGGFFLENRIKDLYAKRSPLLQEYFTTEVTVAAAGDIMVHSPQFHSAFAPETGTYDFSRHFMEISPYLQQADLTVANLETTLTGPAYAYSGYPRFNSPPELAGNLREAGFDLLFTANNHSLDYGETGVLNTIAHLEEAGLDFVGTARNPEERADGYRVNLQQIELAFFAYTYGTNGIPVPRGKDYLVCLIDEGQIVADIQRAKENQGADAVIIALHWGQEYQRLPTPQQRQLARRLIDAGADVIVGTHPHVIQPVEWMETEHHQGLVFYSLGNFISNQRNRYRDSGIIVYFTIKKDLVLQQTTVSLAHMEPTWVLRKNQLGPDRYAILPVNPLLLQEEKMEAIDLSGQETQRLREVKEETEDIFWRYWE